MKYAIVNADDLGWSPAVNRGIIKAFDEGILTSASLLVNGPAYDDALELIRSRPALGVGIHLNLLRGRPILNPSRLKPIVDDRGLFVCSIPRLLYAARTSKSARSCMEAELSAQIKKALGDGIEVTHLDSERHTHFYPAINIIVVRLAARHGIMRLRHIRKGGCLSGSWRRALRYPGGFVKESLLTFFSMINRQNIEAKKLQSPDYLLGVAETAHVTAGTLERWLASLPDGVSEIMCHPGYMDKETAGLEGLLGPASINAMREGELNALLHSRLKALVRNMGIRLINYGNLFPRP